MFSVAKTGNQKLTSKPSPFASLESGIMKSRVLSVLLLGILTTTTANSADWVNLISGDSLEGGTKVGGGATTKSKTV